MANTELLLQARGLRGASIPSKAKLTFFQDKSLSLQLQYKAADSWIDCFSIGPDELNGLLKMPNTAYLGFSAHTGELTDNFDIVSVETRNLYNPVAANAGRNQAAAARASGKGRGEKKSGGWGWFFFKMILFAGVVGGGYVGYTKYREKNRRYTGF